MISKPDLPVASELAASVDNLYAFIFWVCVVCFVVIVGLMTYFVVKYRRKTENDVTPAIDGHIPTEVGVSIGLFVLVMGLFAWGWIDYMKSRNSPMSAYEVNVIGQQWSWGFQYANGKRMQNTIYVPKDTPVKLIMTSSDVLHSFYIPALRLKRDVIPGTYQYLSFTANKTGEYDVFCAEYCGLDHAKMLAKMIVLEKNDFADWEDGVGKYAGDEWRGTKDEGRKMKDGRPLAEVGKELHSSKTCSSCHSDDGSPRVGPSFKGLFGKMEEMKDGKKITIDEVYLRDSMMDPNKNVVKGFSAGSMPPFKGQLSDDEVNALVAYIKSLQ